MVLVLACICAQKTIKTLFIYLSQKQKEMLRALQSGGKVIVKPRKTQSAGFWGALLASIGVSLTIETIRKN